ncbi:MAG: c-type cytochrome [Rhodospirillaceae bacterium]|nr:MAG: c-type cytochrome [Rhodospirillaceae bacterium]
MPKFINNPTFQAIVSAFWLAFLAILGVNLITDFALTGHLLPEKEKVEKFGFPIEVAEASADSGAAAAEAKVDIVPLIAAAKAEDGADVFRKCAACHDASAGGPNKTGPNLHNIVGDAVADRNGFHISDSLKAVGGNWTYDKLDAWLADPRSVASKTLMSFAGLKKPADRAAVIKYLMSQTDNPPPLPAAAAAAPAAPAAPAAVPAKAPAKKAP